jgi:CHAT domain-containing protein
MVADLMPGAQVLHDPSRDSVLAALPRYPIAHFACHGYADWESPSRSSLILRTGPLSVADISALRITSTMAYLSACETGRTAPRFADESTHITGAFHLAGYQHVIGTLWPVSDSAAARLAKDFYAHLTHDGTTPPDASQSARALHDATRRLRARYPANPTQWAAHTHTGI